MKINKNEILDVAEKLFVIRGYDNVSTNDIIAEVKIARGTLYYYFKSKEDILDCIVERVLRDIDEKVRRVAMDERISVLQRLTLAVAAGNVDSDVGEMIVQQAHKPQNAIMHQKIQERLLRDINPYFVKIIDDGIKQGIMHTDYPNEVVEMTLMYANTTFDDLINYTDEEKLRKVKGFIANTERMLGMAEGSLFETMIPMFFQEEK